MSSGTDIAFITLGCAKNEVDSDKMRALLRAAGYRIVDDPEQADLTVVNTCGFLASAVEEGLDTIFAALGVADAPDIPVNKVLVTGCMPSRYGADLEEELQEVAGFLPVDQEGRIVEKVGEILGTQAAAGDASLRDQVGTFAYVKISDGCDRFCSYCMIPYIRGRYHSFPYEDIRAEVAELAQAGVREVVLIGQDTGIWGRDLPQPSCTKELLERLAAEFPQLWLRLMYIQPEGITDELLLTMGSTPNICSYIDIPLQHVDATVLKRMNRSGNPQQIKALLEHIRQLVPDMMIRTTLMAGFPGETEEQFQTLMDFVEDAGFDYAGVFAYSAEEGSKAAEFEDQVDEELRLERAQRLLDFCDSCGFARNEQHIGRRLTCVVEGYESTDAGEEALARWQGQAPDVDGMVHIPLSDVAELQLGDMVEVQVADAFCYELVGELV
ncbi:MAG: 30S ribosomal protein S12 methylthiotransferase RimO [Coriobacteriales bacterium]